jgi:hypothetical protein
MYAMLAHKSKGIASNIITRLPIGQTHIRFSFDIKGRMHDAKCAFSKPIKKRGIVYEDA